MEKPADLLCHIENRISNATSSNAEKKPEIFSLLMYELANSNVPWDYLCNEFAEYPKFEQNKSLYFELMAMKYKTNALLDDLILQLDKGIPPEHLKIKLPEALEQK